MKLQIGGVEIPERCLKFVVLYYESASVSFAGVLVGEKEREMGAELRKLAELKAIPFEVEDRNGVSNTGICDIKDLRLARDGTSMRFSGRLVRPFQN